MKGKNVDKSQRIGTSASSVVGLTRFGCKQEEKRCKYMYEVVIQKSCNDFCAHVWVVNEILGRSGCQRHRF